MLFFFVAYSVFKRSIVFAILGPNPFQNLQKELTVNGECFRYFDISSFEELGNNNDFDTGKL